MPIPMQTKLVAVEPNTVRYDLWTSSQVSPEGRLVVGVSVSLTPVCYDEKGIYSEGFTNRPPVQFSIQDVEQYATDNPEVGMLLLNAWAALSLVVNAINEKNKLL